MENLLKNNFTAYYRLPPFTQSIDIIQSDEAYFEIEDTAQGNIKLHNLRGKGEARFSNPLQTRIKIINYDKFITKLPISFQTGKKRCDLLISNNTHFALAELKNRDISVYKKRSDVRKKARKQLLESLEILIEVPQIKTFINSKAIKKCCYFNKQTNNPPSSINAVRAFNRLSTTIENGLQINLPEIEKYNFEYWEFLGTQTLILR